MLDFNDTSLRERSKSKSFTEAIKEAGLSPPSEPVADGQIHRFPSNGDSNDKAGWYVLFDNGDGLFAGSFGCWRSGIEETWKSAPDNELSSDQREKLYRRIEQAKEDAEATRRQKQAEAKERACAEYEKLKPVQDHPYLHEKGVGAYGSMPLKVDVYGNLIVPVHDMDGNIHSLQRVSAKGEKNFLKDGRTKGLFHVLPGNEEIIIAEGYATGASVHEATGATVVCAFNAGNLQSVAEQFRESYPAKELTIAADNDRWTSLLDGRVNPGLIKGQAAAEAVQGRMVYPEFKNLRDHPKDFNDLARLEGLHAVKEFFRDQAKSKVIWDNPLDLLSLVDVEPEPISWFVQDRITTGRGFVVTGVGGSSKTRMIYHLAAGAALGRLPWGWQVSQKGRSILVLTEDVADDLHRTMHNLCLSLDISYEEKRLIYSSIIPYPLAGEDVKLLTKTREGTLQKSFLFQALAQKVRDLGDVAFVGLDPALSLTDGDELDQGNQRALGKMADDLAVQTGAACALVTHATKGSLIKDELTSHNSRGGGAITDAVRAEFVMRTMTSREAIKAKLTDPEERFRHVQLVGTKGNYLPPDAYIPVWLRRDEYGMLHEAEITFGEDGPTAKDTEALDVLRDNSKTKTLPLKEWREACVQAGILKSSSEEGQKKEMERIKNKLKNSSLIKPGHGRGVWLPNDDFNSFDFN